MLLMFCVLCVLYVVWTWYLRTYPSRKEPPYYEGMLPIIGHLHQIVGDRTRFYKFIRSLARDCEKKGGVVRVYLGTNKYYAITDPEDVMTAANACTQKNYQYELAKPWVGNGLVTASGAIWQRHKKLLIPAFNTRLMYSYLNIFNSQARSLVEDLAPKVGGGPFDIINYVKVTAVKTLFKIIDTQPIKVTNFGIDVMEDRQFLKSYIKATEVMNDIMLLKSSNPWFQNDFIFKLSGYARKQNEALKILHGASDFVTQKKKEELKKCEGSKSSYKPLLELLIELCESGTFTEQEVRDEVNTAGVATYETSASILFFVIANIGTYPHIQEKLYDEIRSICGDSDRDVEKDDMPKLMYTEAVINETLRLYQTAPALARYVSSDVRLKNWVMTAGSNCFLMVVGMNRGSLWGPDVDEFRPERWLNPQELPPSSVQNSTFGLGKRLCIGKGYAMLSMKTTIVHLIRNYRFTADVTKIKVKVEIVLTPLSGHLVRLERRNSYKDTNDFCLQK